MNLVKLTSVIVAMLWSMTVFAQPAELWTLFDESDWDIPESSRQIIPNEYQSYELDFKNIKLDLAQAPIELSQNTQLLTLPTPDNGFMEFRIVAFSNFEPTLAAKYPEIQSYKGWAVEDPSITIRLDYSPKGFHAMVLAGSQTWFVDPYAKDDTKDYIVYYKRAFQKEETFTCGVEEGPSLKIIGDMPEYGDCELRSYRLALACTGEYAAFHGGTVAGALAAMNTTINRVNGVYEREFSVHLVLVGNTDQLIYLDANTDPYSNNDGATMLSENQTTIDNVIGSSNYDIGHVFSTGGGGIAALGSPCSSFKAQGVTGSSAPVGDPFDVDYVCHEMGHQFGANHTQNNPCNSVSTTSMEPGSASTIMGYAGVCFPNIQNNSDDYFHSISLLEINNFITNAGGTCASLTPSGNTPPVVSAGDDYVIPVSTSFVLEAMGSDGDGDPLTYCWEQMDPEAATMPPENTSTVGPLFRSYDPSLDTKRYFPRLADIVANASPTWEVLPNVARDLNFRVTSRDSHNGNGCTSIDDMKVTVSAVAGPFLVNQPNTNVDWPALSSQTVLWTVANTNQAPINASTVDIFLSLDGGFTYPDTLAMDVPNDGSQDVEVPNELTSAARVMVKGHGNIFFDISNVNFTISEVQEGFNVSIAHPTTSFCSPTTGSISMNLESILGYTGTVSVTAQNVPNGMTVTFDPSSPAVPDTVAINVSTTTTLEDGWHIVDIVISGSTGTKTKQISIFSAQAAPAPVALLSPADGSTGALVKPLLTWTPSNNVLEYQVAIYSDVNLTNVVESQILPSGSASYEVSNALNPSSTYYWTVMAFNACQDGTTTDVFSFTTKAIFCNLTPAADVPVIIPTSSTSIQTSTIHLTESGELTAIKIKNLDITHTYIKDLRIKLIAPDGTTVKLIDGICTSEDNILMGFDDASNNTYAGIPCPPVNNGIYQPLESLDALLGKTITGDWVLSVEDTYAEDGGQLNGWSLDICYLVGSLTLAVNTTDVTCFGEQDGTATPIVAGGTAPYTFTWSEGNGTNLSAGNYSVTVTDATETSKVSNFVIQQPTKLTLSALTTNTIPGMATGAIDLSVFGGTPGYNYSWSINDATTQDVSDLAANTYSVVVTDSKGCIADTSIVIYENCTVPSQVSYSILSATSVSISWLAITGVNSYQIRYRVVGATDWIIQTVTPNTITLDGLVSGATYEYQVQSHCTDDWSDYSPLSNFTLPEPCNAPIDIETVSVGADNATIGWAVIDNASGYVVSYREIGTTTWLTQSTTTNAISITGLIGSTSYELMVQTTCGAFSSESSNVIVFTTLMGCEPPTNIQASILSYESFELTWDNMANATLYSVRYRKLGETFWTSVTTETPSLVITGLESGETYEYQVQSKCNVYWSNPSTLAQITLPVGCEVLSLVGADATDHSVSFSWNSTAGALKYRVSYRVAGSTDEWITYEITETASTIDGLEAEQSYTLFVQALCQFGWGPESIHITLDTSPLGVESVDSERFMMYPNPVGDLLNLLFVERPEKIVIQDVLGRVVYTKKGSLKMVVPVATWESGLYFVRVYYKDGALKTGKFLKN